MPQLLGSRKKEWDSTTGCWLLPPWHRSEQVRANHDRHGRVLQPRCVARRRSRRLELRPGLPDVVGEQFVDYTDFSYTRSEVFQGCSTWLDVPTLTWETAKITDIVHFTDVVAGAAQLAR